MLQPCQNKKKVQHYSTDNQDRESTEKVLMSKKEILNGKNQ